MTSKPVLSYVGEAPHTSSRRPGTLNIPGGQTLRPLRDGWTHCDIASQVELGVEKEGAEKGPLGLGRL